MQKKYNIQVNAAADEIAAMLASFSLKDRLVVLEKAAEKLNSICTLLTRLLYKKSCLKNQFR